MHVTSQSVEIFVAVGDHTTMHLFTPNATPTCVEDLSTRDLCFVQLEHNYPSSFTNIISPRMCIRPSMEETPFYALSLWSIYSPFLLPTFDSKSSLMLKIMFF